MQYYSSFGLFQPFENMQTVQKEVACCGGPGAVGVGGSSIWPLGYSLPRSVLEKNLRLSASFDFISKCCTRKYCLRIGKPWFDHSLKNSDLESLVIHM